MPAPTCPLCSMDHFLSFPNHLERATCGRGIACRMNGLSIALKACYVKKVPK
jgi:hypothetical protein